MGAVYRIEPETGLVVFDAQDALTYSAWESAVLGVLASTPTPTSRRRFLSDRRRTEKVQSLELVESIMKFFRRHADTLGDMQWALLASSQSRSTESCGSANPSANPPASGSRPSPT